MFSRGLISAADLNQKTILSLLSATHKILKIPTRKQGVLAFFEPSSRTKSSFELAGMDLGIQWLDFELEKSSLKKGESFKDSIELFSNYPIDVLVLRHKDYGASFWSQHWLQKPVINAGEGSHEHPTQALGDALCLHELSKSKSWKICFYGDYLKSRVFRSCVQIFKKLNWQLYVCEDGQNESQLLIKSFGLKSIKRTELKKMDIVYVLRVQKERGAESILGALKMKDVASKTQIMHAGPVMWGEDLEIAFQMEMERLLIQRQVSSCYFIRRKLLSEVLRGSR